MFFKAVITLIMAAYSFSEHTCLLELLHNPRCRRLLWHTCAFSMPTKLAYALYYNYADGSVIKRIIWHDQKFERRQFPQTLSHNDLWIRANTTIDTFQMCCKQESPSKSDSKSTMVRFSLDYHDWKANILITRRIDLLTLHLK